MNNHYQYTISFSIEVQNVGKKGWEAENALRQKLLSEDFAGWDSQNRDIVLDPRRSEEIIALMERVQVHPQARIGHTSLSLELNKSAAESAEWFIARPDFCSHMDHREDRLEEIRADQMDESSGWYRAHSSVLVSQRWRDAVESEKLSGIEYLWCIDKGLYAAAQWFIAHTRLFLGRGIDHPWFDPNTRGQAVGDRSVVIQPTHPDWIGGVNEFEKNQLCEVFETEFPELRKLIDQMRKCLSASFSAPKCVLREFLPKSEFAYMRDGQPKKGAEHLNGTYLLCCSAKARNLLLSTRLARPGHFEAIEVVEAPSEGVLVFDGYDVAPIPPFFSREEFNRSLENEAKLLPKIKAKPTRPTHPIPLTEVFPVLARRITEFKSESGATPDEISSAENDLDKRLPSQWIELLKQFNGFNIESTPIEDGYGELRFASVSELPDEHRHCSELLVEYGVQPSDSYVCVGTTACGDFLLLDTSKLSKEGDCPVMYISHESGETFRVWPAISLFLTEAIAKMDDE